MTERINERNMNMIDLDQLTLDHGAHQNFEEGACLLEVASYLAGEPFSDHPKCVSPVITAYGIRLNDRLGDADRQKLKQFLPGMLNTAGDGLDDIRHYILADWAIRVATPRWLDAAGLTADATRLRETAPVTDAATMQRARDAARAVRAKTYELRQTRRAALRDKIIAQMKKNPKADLTVVADAVADAAAVAVADAAAVAAAVAVVAAVAAVDAVAAVAAVADVDADVDAVAVAAAVAVVAAAAVAVVAAVVADVADVDAAAAADPRNARWAEVYTAVKAKLLPIYREGLKGSKYAEVRELNRAEGIELLGKILKPATTPEGGKP